MSIWQIMSLNDLGEVARGKSKHRPRNDPTLYGGAYPFIQTGDVKAASGLVTSYNQTYSEKGLAQSRLWPKGTMVITIAANIAETAILNFPACFPDSVVGFIADQDKASVRFIEYLFRNIKKKIQGQYVGTGSAQDNINLQKIGAFELSVPPISEQREIASILGALDDKIELNRRMSATLEEMARSLYRSWFVDFDPVHAKMEDRQPAFMDEATATLFPDRFGGDGLPEGWINTQLESIFKSRNERDDGRNIQEFTSSNEGLFPRDQKYHKKLAASGSKNKIAYRGDFVFGLSRKVLNFGMLHQEIGAFSSAYRIYSVDAGYDFSCYIYEYMKFFPDYYYQAVSASSREGQSISDRNLLDLLVPVPPISILTAFFEETEAFKKRIFSLESETNNLVGLRDSLLPKLMSGEIRVGEAREQIEEIA